MFVFANRLKLFIKNFNIPWSLQVNNALIKAKEVLMLCKYEYDKMYTKSIPQIEKKEKLKEYE